MKSMKRENKGLKTFPSMQVICFSLIALALVIFFYHCLQLWTFTADDSFITFRYSSNLVNGIGPTYNAGLPRAEGYTSFLWMLIMTIPHYLNFGTVSFSKLMGIGATLGTMALIFVFIEKAAKIEKPVARVVGSLFLLCYALLPETAVHAVSGMETALYNFSLIGLLFLCVQGIQGESWALKWLPAAGLVNGLLRPEANGLVLLVFIMTLIFVKNKPRFFLHIFLFYLLPGGLYFVWRWIYYGVFLPLPFYIKTGGSGLVGWPYVQSFLIFIFVNLLLLLGLSVFGPRRVVLPVMAIVIADLSFFLFVYPVMGYDFRFIYPVMSLVMVLAGIGLSFILKTALLITQTKRNAWLAVSWICLLFLASFTWNNLPRVKPLFEHKIAYASGLLSNHVKIGQTLAAVAQKENAPVLVVKDAGAIPYYAGWTTIDALGLNDANIALKRVNTKEYIFDQNPEILILTSNDINSFQSDSVLTNVLYDAAIKQGMITIARNPFYQGDAIWIMGFPGTESTLALAELANDND